MYTQQAGRTPALQQNWQSSRKSPNFKEKTQYLLNTLYVYNVNVHKIFPVEHGKVETREAE